MSKLSVKPRGDENSLTLKSKQLSGRVKINKDSSSKLSPIVKLQNQVGNAAVQRLLAQRSGDGPTELDDETANRINSARGGGQSLDGDVQTKMGDAMGSDFSGVRVHTGSESNELNQQLGARAFTTGQDVFFGDGEYSPSSSSGQELIAHELTHVVQQSSGAVPSSGGGMQVNAPGDQFEQEADTVAKQVTSMDVAPAQGGSDVQRQEMDEEEMVQGKMIQREEMPEEELQTKMIQREEMPEEELQTKMVQREEMPEEEVQAKMIQREEMPEEEQMV